MSVVFLSWKNSLDDIPDKNMIIVKPSKVNAERTCVCTPYLIVGGGLFRDKAYLTGKKLERIAVRVLRTISWQFLFQTEITCLPLE